MTFRLPAPLHMTSFLRRIVGVGLVVLLVLAQGVAAADRCFLERLPGGGPATAAFIGDLQHGLPGAHCATDPGVESQAPGTEPRRFVIDPDAGAVQVAQRHAAPRLDLRLVQREPLPTGPPRNLQFRSLRL